MLPIPLYHRVCYRNGTGLTKVLQEGGGAAAGRGRGPRARRERGRAQVSWEVAPWGSWRVFARSGRYEALVEATCARPGTPLRAPTVAGGLAPFCRDSFHGEARRPREALRR